MTKQQNKWNADAEALLMGFTLPVENEDHLTHMVKYILNFVGNVLHFEDIDIKTEEVLENALNKYNDGEPVVKYVSVQSAEFGILMTFVRDDEGDITSRNGVLAWVENLTYPDCSELGYVFFAKDKNQGGKLRRIG